MLTDLRDAWRGLRAAPGATALALMMLTLGIAVATITFSVVDAVALRPLPLPTPDRLIAIARTTPNRPDPGPVATQDYFAWRDAVPAVEQLGAIVTLQTRLGTGSDAESVLAARVSLVSHKPGRHHRLRQSW